MGKPIGIRLPKDVLKRIEKLSKEENVDRSTMIRELVLEGYKGLKKKEALEKYKEGKITFSKAAKEAGMTLWEMEKFLVEKGYKSEYSIEDLEKESKLLE